MQFMKTLGTRVPQDAGERTVVVAFDRIDRARNGFPYLAIAYALMQRPGVRRRALARALLNFVNVVEEYIRTVLRTAVKRFGGGFFPDDWDDFTIGARA